MIRVGPYIVKFPFPSATLVIRRLSVMRIISTVRRSRPGFTLALFAKRIESVRERDYRSRHPWTFVIRELRRLPTLGDYIPAGTNVDTSPASAVSSRSGGTL